MRILSAGKPIDAAGGHAAPCVADLDGDGVRDLLVGQFLWEGPTRWGARIRYFRNRGTDKAPRFLGFTNLKGGDVEARAPTG